MYTNPPLFLPDSPSFSVHTALFAAGGFYPLLSTLQDPLSPPHWRLLSLRTLWQAVQDPPLLAQFCTEVRRSSQPLYPLAWC